MEQGEGLPRRSALAKIGKMVMGTAAVIGAAVGFNKVLNRSAEKNIDELKQPADTVIDAANSNFEQPSPTPTPQQKENPSKFKDPIQTLIEVRRKVEEQRKQDPSIGRARNPIQQLDESIAMLRENPKEVPDTNQPVLDVMKKREDAK